MTTVVVADTTAGLEGALEAILAPHGGVEALIPKAAGTVYIKPNGIHYTAQTHTDPRVLEAVLRYLRDHGYRRLAVMEGCTGGNFTRLVFRISGYAALCRRYGARAVYLDEGPTEEVSLRDGSRIRVARALASDILHRDGNYYLSLPKLKTHPMTKVTLGIKNQQAFPIAPDRMHHHSHTTLHQRLAALYALTRPDFCIIEGLAATAHGHFPATALLSESVVPMNLLIGGLDTLAVDVVGARVLGYGVDEVEHLRLCKEWGLGEADLDRIDVRGCPLEEFQQRLPYTLLGRFHPDVRWVVGREKACIEGCRGNSECIQEMLANDFAGRGGWTLVCGSGFEDADLDDLPGDILVVGPCACQQALPALQRRYAGRKIYTVPEHNDLMANTRYQARLMGITPVRMVPLHPVVSAMTLLNARLHGLRARVPPLLG
jgi:uncharacterized protein (DUF362 family)